MTGAAGYLGSRLCAWLKASGDVDVRALVRREVPWVAAEQVVADLCRDDLRPALDGVDAVVHLAGANEAAADPDAALASTVVAARRVADAAAGRRVVHVSTVHVYGAAMSDGATVDEQTLPAPRHPYAVARLASEHLLAGPNTVVLRLTNAVGAPLDPRIDRWTLVANDLCRQAAVDGALRLRTHGLQWRDFVHLDDACRIIAAAVDRLPAGTYDLGRGEPMTVRALAVFVQDAFERLTGARPPLRAPRPPERAPLPVTVSVARLAALGLRAELPIELAIDETARFCLDHRTVLRG